jgi:ribosome-binding ATPase YchF (GTP1/OBG family)
MGVPVGVAKDQWERMSLQKEPPKWKESEYRGYSRAIRERTKPFLIAANKSDSKFAQKNIESLKNDFPGIAVIPMCADYELALHKAVAAGFATCDGKKISVTQKGRENQRIADAINKIASFVEAHGSTGVADAIDRAVYGLAGYMVAFPVEDENHYSNHFGKVLPDAILLKKGSTPLDLAAAIHADLAKHFLYAVDAQKKTRMGKEHALEDGAVVKIVSAK